MKLRSIKTKKIHPSDDLVNILDTFVKKIAEKSILLVTSKIVSLCEGAHISKEEVNKEQLIMQEADLFCPPSVDSPHPFYLTIKNNILIPSAGIDESNAKEVFIVYPKRPFVSAEKIWRHFRQRDSLQHFGVIITDSHTTPLRRGVTGIALSWCGFEPLKKYVGTMDCFGQPLRYTYRNTVDALATAGVFMMGEGDEQTPLCLIEDIPDVVFQDTPPSNEEIQSVSIPIEEDLYGEMLRRVPWRMEEV